MKIVDFFKNIFNKKQSQGLLNKPKTKYQEYVESIDDLELCEMFINGITPELENVKEKYGVGDYQLQTKISVADSIEIAKKFFESIDINFAKKVNDITLGTNPDVILETKNVDFAETTNPDEKPVKVRVPIRGDLRQLYEFAHECTHTFDIDNGWTETRLVLAEVAPQCMERLLDEYLLGMSEAELKKYGFDKRVLEKDIQDRRLSTFFNRLWNIETLNGKHPIKDRRKDSNYMLAQIYSAHFNKFDKSQKRNKLISFIKCVNNDDFDGANNCFGLLINRNQKLH